MAVRLGNNITLYIDVDEDTAAGSITEAHLDSDYTQIKGVTGCSFSANNNSYEVNFKQVTPADGSTPPSLASTRQLAIGTTSSTLTVEGVYDPSLDNNVDEIFTEALGKTDLGVFIRDENAGFGCIGGIGFCTSFELSAGMDDFVTFSATFELTGDPVIIASA